MKGRRRESQLPDWKLAVDSNSRDSLLLANLPPLHMIWTLHDSKTIQSIVTDITTSTPTRTLTLTITTTCCHFCCYGTSGSLALLLQLWCRGLAHLESVGSPEGVEGLGFRVYRWASRVEACKV